MLTKKTDNIIVKLLRLFKKYPFMVALKMIMSRLAARIFFFIPDRYFLIKYRGGRIYLNLKESGMMIDRALGVYEYWKVRLLTDLIKPGMTAVDIGANKGDFSLLMAKLMNDRGKVLSFEPVPDNCYWLKKSIEANNYKSIKLFQVALSNKNGTANFYPGKVSGWGSFFFTRYADTNKKPTVVKTRKLDDILNEEGIDSIDIIKIDVEGADILVLKGAEDILKRSKDVKLLMDIDVESDEEKKQLFDILNFCGFKIYNIGKQIKLINKINEAEKDIYATKTK